MKKYHQISAIAVTLPRCLAVIYVLSLTACSSSKNYTKLYPIKAGDNIVLQEPCYFIDSPGVCNLVPTNSSYVGDYHENRKGIVPKGAKVEFLGIYEESGFMADSRIRSYGRIVDGEFRAKKTRLDYVLKEQCKEDGQARSTIENAFFQHQ
jgi:hypothetical protein